MPSGNNEYGSKAVLPRDRFTIHILYSFFTEKPRPSGRGFFVSISIHPSLAFSSAGIISSAQMHPQLALLCRRDYFFCPDSSLSCSFVVQGLFRPPGFIPILLFSSAGIIATARIHPYLALLCCRDDFFCSDASPACFFVPQGLFLPLRCISILLFFTAGITSSARIHPQLAFFTAEIISSARLHPYLALFFRRDDFFCTDASLSCSFPPQGLLRPPGFISILLFFSTGIIATARLHPQLAFLCCRDYFRRPDSSPACFFHHRDYCDRPDSSLSCSYVPQGLLLPPGFILILLFSSAGMISDCDDPP